MNVFFRIIRFAAKKNEVFRSLVFRQAIRLFCRNPERALASNSHLLAMLVVGWGNEAWGATVEFLREAIRTALHTEGPIFECGSGLSTLLVGKVADDRRLSLWSFEDDIVWAERIESCLRRYKIHSVRLNVRPLKVYGDFAWYDTESQNLPDSFSMVICDGPPGRTKGGRSGLFPVLKNRLSADVVILLDDTNRAHERALSVEWAEKLNASVDNFNQNRSFAILRAKAR